MMLTPSSLELRPIGIDVQMRLRPEPFQLELFPTTVRLIRCAPLRNENRFYAMTATPTLFGDWTLIREWGRRGSPGRLRYDPHRSVGEAITALLALQRQKLRRGYQLAWT